MSFWKRDLTISKDMSKTAKTPPTQTMHCWHVWVLPIVVLNLGSDNHCGLTFSDAAAVEGSAGEELGGTQAVMQWWTLPWFGSMHPSVYERPGPLSLSKMRCLGNGRERVPKGQWLKSGWLTAGWLPSASTRRSKVIVELSFYFLCTCWVRDRKEKRQERTMRWHFSLPWSKCFVCTIATPQVWIYGQLYRQQMCVLYPGGLSLIKIWLQFSEVTLFTKYK